MYYELSSQYYSYYPEQYEKQRFYQFINLVLSIAAIMLVWTAVRRKFLFSVIPR